MFSIVLVMTLGSGGDAPTLRPADLERRDRSITGHVQYCHRRCTGGGNGGWGGCHGGRGGWGSCHGGYGCHGAYACHGGYASGCHGSSYTSGYYQPGYYQPGYGVPPGNSPQARPMPETIKAAPKPSSEEQEVMAPTPATIRVSLPVDAKLTVNGNPTTTEGTSREFVSPPLEPNHSFTYTLKAETTRDGQPFSQTKAVTVRAGRESEVTFPPSSTN